MNKLFKNRRKTIGVLINSFDGFYQSPVCRGIKKVAEERNFDVLFFAGGALMSPLKDEAKQNVIYDLVNIDIKDIPSIVFDNRECMHSMVDHLI